MPGNSKRRERKRERAGIHRARTDLRKVKRRKKLWNKLARRSKKR